MPRPKAFPPAIIAHAVNEYIEGHATMPALAQKHGCNPATISRWVAKARARGLPAWHPEHRPADQPASSDSAPLSPKEGALPITPLAQRVAELAPPPAPPPPPPGPDVSTGDPKALMARAAQMIERLIQSSERARAQGDPRVEATTISAIVKTLTEIRQLQTSVADAGGETFAFSREELDAARESVQRKIDALGPATCPECGAELRRLWAIDGAEPTSDTVTADRNSDAGVTPSKGKPGA